MLEWKYTERERHRAYLGLGSNLGNKIRNLRQAVELLGESEGITLSGVSSLYETEPIGYLDQDLFVNCAIAVETTLEPHELLEVCQQVERDLHRKREIRWGPRTIDVDILLYDSLRVDTLQLTLPHPRMKERAFVLVPLAELDEDVLVEGKSPAELLPEVSLEGIRKMTESLGFLDNTAK